MLAWVGTISNIIGSFTVAFGFLLYGYGLFLVGSVTWLMVAMKRKDKALGTLNLAFLCANIVGLTRAIF